MEQIEELCRAGEIELEWADIWGEAETETRIMILKTPKGGVVEG